MTGRPALDERLERLAQQCLRAGVTLATAESCTGGGVGSALTSIAGSSRWYQGGVISYSNQMKQRVLGVSTETLENQGAVSEACAREMLLGVLEVTGADLAVSVTGIAGPDGGSPQKPVGTVCFGWGGRQSIQVHTLVFEGDRESVRRQSVVFAIEQLLNVTEGWSKP